MKNKFIIFVITIALLTTTAYTSEKAEAFATEPQADINSSIQAEVTEISNDLCKAREDGKISAFDEIVATYDTSLEARNAFNDLAMEEAKQELSELPVMKTNSEENINETETFDLDCGAQLVIKMYSEDVSEYENTGFIGRFMQTFIQSANAYDTVYGTKKYYQSAIMLAAGTVTIKSWTTVTASATGLKITAVNSESDSSIVMNDLETKKMIEDQYADAAGTNCHSRAAVKYNLGVLGLHGPSDWYNLRVTFTLSKIDKVNKKVYYTYDKDTWYSDSWY